MITVYENLTEKELAEKLKMHGIKKNEIKKELNEAKADHRIIAPMFSNILYCFVVQIEWSKKRKYTLMQKTLL